jgi:thiamine-monophosphate kinase
LGKMPSMLSEFDLIARYFTRSRKINSHTALGVGDDCALLSPAPGSHIAISSDMLVEERHFFPGADPIKLGHKCLAVNLSDLAAMGAEPVAFTLALSLPEINEPWLEGFSRGMYALADAHGCELIGGDTTKGPLTICITVFGYVPAGQALRRDVALPGDDIWVSGTLGDARLALAGRLAEMVVDTAATEAAAVRMDQPTPRVALGMQLRGIAHAALDVSDGLAGDLAHILKASRVGATLNADALPFGPTLDTLPQETRRQYALAGGDDYELCFTAPASKREQVLAAAQAAGTPVTLVGRIEEQQGLRITDNQGKAISVPVQCFDHFKTP